MQELFEEQAARRPDAIAVALDGEELSYGELNRRANRLAHHLRRRGVGPEVAVGVCLERSLDLAVGLLGALKAGGVYVPLDPEQPEERRSWMVSDSGAEVVLSAADRPETASETEGNPEP